jgi:hypothetical protein
VTAAEFYAAIDRGTRSDAHKPPSPGFVVYTGAEKVLRKLQDARRVKTLADPTLVTTVDQPATMMSGGEFPILIPTSNGKVSTEWRWFGVRCAVVPHWLETGKLELDVAPEFAVRDFNNAVKSNGLTVPGLTTCRTSVRLEMNLGETAVVNLGPTPECQEESPSPMQAAIRLVNAELGIAPPKPPVTLFLVTPDAADPTSKSSAK